MIVDESSNLSFHELDSIMTRVGENTKIIFCGDHKQSDLEGSSKREYLHFKSIISRMKEYFDVVNMTVDDIVRSGFVKAYLIEKEKQET